MQSTVFLESNGSDDEEQGAPGFRRPAAPRERQRKAARARRPRSQPGTVHTTRAAKGEPLTVAAPPANCVPPAAVSQSSPQGATEPNSAVTPSSLSATPTLKIRLPRFSLSTKSTPTSPVQARTGERPRRSIRRQTSTTGSSSTSISKGDGRISAAESPRE